ncbi:MAG: N-acetyl-gamma-glutamyl-phosphate reductase [Gammaproteobacteria bacterium]|nr:MAG: N-acetyl-gamma-glutamyl-phosphate reductase [Gammaproteobacteria bacterium]
MTKIGIIGGTGYTGVELIRLLARHPQAELVVVTSRAESGRRVSEVFPSLRDVCELAYSLPDRNSFADCDAVFSATPNGIAMTMARDLMEADIRLIDLAADFRIKDSAVWEHWYGMEHACPELLDEAVYGLPEMNREAIRTARLLANPGCYPTAITLGWLPLLKAGLVDVSDLIADAKSGVSGAGRGANIGTLLTEAADSFKAYGLTGHRHHPEIAQTLLQLSGQPPGFVFTPHLAPMIRGIYATLYAKLVTEQAIDLQQLYEEAYADEPFVDVMPAGSLPETRSVRGSNVCRIAVYRNEQRVIVLSVIDNLVKGAAGQALQNFNLMFGFDEKTGLETVPLAP